MRITWFYFNRNSIYRRKFDFLWLYNEKGWLLKGGGVLENELTRKEQIHAKGFDINNRYQEYSTVSDYKKIKVGVK